MSSRPNGGAQKSRTPILLFDVWYADVITNYTIRNIIIAFVQDRMTLSPLPKIKNYIIPKYYIKQYIHSSNLYWESGTMKIVT